QRGRGRGLETGDIPAKSHTRKGLRGRPVNYVRYSSLTGYVVSNLSRFPLRLLSRHCTQSRN
ncbi:MAG: hypothetical protein QNL45_05205, partial [Nitrospirota bacterium]|nr:hypothetical protein [Nitrospirota bacterium]